jgi:heme-degrading monooxygenase HmoA
MFARVITTQTADGFDAITGVFRDQLPTARLQPGFKGFYILTDAETGKLMIISLWETREQMEAVAGGGVRHEAAPAGLTPPHLETYEVAMHG